MNTKEVAGWLREVEGFIRTAGVDYSQVLHWDNTSEEFEKLADDLLDRAVQVEAMTCDG